MLISVGCAKTLEGKGVSAEMAFSQSSGAFGCTLAPATASTTAAATATAATTTIVTAEAGHLEEEHLRLVVADAKRRQRFFKANEIEAYLDALTGK